MMWILILLFALAFPAHAQSGSPASEVVSDGAWQATLERVIPAVVAIRVTGTRDFDTEDARSSVGTGFVVDAERGILLTNRHMVHAGPVIAEAVFLNNEEVPLQAIYRDPIHDFGFYRFDPAHLRYMALSELPLAPEAAVVGREIRIVGNDAGEKISILAGTLARLDRGAPNYGGNTYNDFNTFYLQAASGTSGGSSGSPVVDVDGRVIALNAGGRRDAASSFYLPLDRVVRALELVQRGEPVARGTIHTVFEYLPYDEVRRLGLTEASERALRLAFPDATGALVVDRVVPGGGAHGALAPGDVLLRVNGALTAHFVPLGAALDARVGETVEVEVERGGEAVRVEVPVEDLHAITPDEYLEVGRGVVHTLSYQQARNHALPPRGVYVAVAGYMLGRAGVPRGALITAIDGEPVPDLDTFERIVASRASGERIVVRFHPVSDRRREQVVVATVDRLWFTMQRCRRDDTTGVWPCEASAEPPALPASPEVEVEPLTASSAVGRRVAPSLVMVEFNVPHPTAGVKAFNYVGTGVVVDAERGLVLVDRDTVPVALGDIEIVFAGALRVPGRLLWLHPVHNAALLAYDPERIGDTPVQPLTFVDRELRRGDKVFQVGLDRGFRVVSHEAEVDQVRMLDLGAARTPRYRDYNVEGISLATSQSTLGGVLVDRRGRAFALWASFVDQAKDERAFYGLPTAFLPPLPGPDEVAPGPYCAPGFEARRVPLAAVQDRGLSTARVRALIDRDPVDRGALEVVRVMGGSTAEAGGLRAGDLLLAARVDGASRVVSTVRDLERLAADLCGAPTGALEVLRDTSEVEVPFGVTLLGGEGTNRAVSWAGLTVHAPHVDVAAQEGVAAQGVYVAWLWFGSPGARYGLRPTRRIIEVDGVPTPDLDAFLAAVRDQRDGQAVRLKTETLDGQEQVVSLKLDLHYWPLTELVRQQDGTWLRR